MMQIVDRTSKMELDKAYEDYIYQGIKEAEEQIKNGAKSYSEEEFNKIMKEKYGVIL